MLDDSVFTAELENGHRFVAVAKGLPAESRAELRPGHRVTVEFSPYDMSQARVVRSEVRDESSKFSQENV